MPSEENRILKDKEFLKNIFKLFGSSFISQLLPFAVLPVISRMFSDEDFGKWAYFLSISSLLSVLLTGNYEYAVVLPKEKKHALNVFAGSSAFSVLISLLSALSLFLYFRSSGAGSLFSLTQDAAYLAVILSLIMAFFRLLNYWNNRENKFHRTAAGTIVRSITLSLSQILNGLYFLKDHTGLIFSSAAGYAAGVLVQSPSLVRNIVSHRKEISIGNIRTAMKRYSDFPKYFMPGEFLNSLSVNVPVLFLTNLFGSSYAGLYAIPHRFINVPLTMLGTSISQAYLKKSSDLVNADSCLGETTYEIYRKLFSIGIIPLSLIAGYGDHIFGFLLGRQWSDAGLYASLLAPWMLMVFVASPISIIFATLEKQKVSLFLNGILLLVRVSSFVIGGVMFKSVFAAVFLYGASGFIYWTYYSFFVIRTAGGPEMAKMAEKYVLRRLILIMLPIIISRTALCIIMN